MRSDAAERVANLIVRPRASSWGPEGERLAKDMSARMDQMIDELRAGPPFEVFGLAEPSLRPRALAEFGKSNQGWHLVSLFYGKGLTASGPTVTVRSAIQWRVGPREPPLEDALDDERDRCSITLGSTSWILPSLRYGTGPAWPSTMSQSKSRLFEATACGPLDSNFDLSGQEG